MRKLSFLFIVLLLILVGCSNSGTTEKTEAELREQIKAELIAKEAAKTNQDANNNMVLQTRETLTNEQIEVIANDIVKCFDLYDEQTLSIDSEVAERFSYYLVMYIKDQQHILDYYIPSIEKLVPSQMTELKNNESGLYVDGKYIEVLGEAIFNVDITPEPLYQEYPSDPGLVESSIQEIEVVEGKYIVTLDILDGTVGNPFLSLELHLRLTDKGYTRIEYVATKKMNTEDTKPSASEKQDSTNEFSEGVLFDRYEVNQEYKLYNLNNKESLDIFSVFQSNINDSQQEFYVLINSEKYNLDNSVPELTFHQYKITKNNDSGNYVFVFSVADPPDGADIIYFYEYEPNYSLEKLGYVIPGSSIQDFEIKTLTYSEVKIDDRTYTLEFE